MNWPLLVAGALTLAGAFIHGVGGEMLVVRRLFRTELPSTIFGGSWMTKSMIRVTWHVATIGFLALGAGLAACGSSGAGTACGGFDLGAASVVSAITLLLAVVSLMQNPRAARHLLVRHPAPLLFIVVTALTWWGAL